MGKLGIEPKLSVHETNVLTITPLPPRNLFRFIIIFNSYMFLFLDVFIFSVASS
jgi:hypothetical protein